jgi:hypothetical protein
MKTKFNLVNIEDQMELLAMGDAIVQSRKIATGLQNEVKDCLRACRSNPDHAGNWESLVESIEATK